MKNAVIRMSGVFLLFVVVAELLRLIFMLVYGIGSWSTRPEALAHGLTMDMSVAGYLTVIPGLMIIAELLAGDHRRWISVMWRSYAWIVSALISFIYVLDMTLYAYWGFRLDMTPVFYFMTSPASALAGIPSLWMPAIGVVVAGLMTWGFAWALIGLRRHLPIKSRRRVIDVVVMTILVAALFLPIRGGVTVASMNVSHAYFSSDRSLNHAAVNPAFSLLYSATHQHDFTADHSYMSDSDVERLSAELDSLTATQTDAPSSPLLTDPRPDIYIVILESFSTHLMPGFGGQPIAVGLDSMARAGLCFANIYANSFRTDRSIPAIVSAFPSQPTMSLMKYVDKTEQLPSIASELAKQGYATAYYYGGDINFTNMQAYVRNAGFTKIVSDNDFPLSRRTGKWGVHDHLLFARVLADMGGTSDEPQLRVVQTSSSHEPFEVPYHSERWASVAEANAFAYTDSCLTAFVNTLRQSPRWEQTLIVMVPDHQGCLPKEELPAIERHHIPMVMTGGALHPSMRGVTVATTGSQVDLAATLLGGMGLSCEAMPFSHSLLSEGPHYAVITDPNVAMLITAHGDTAVVDIVGGGAVHISRSTSERAVSHTKAYMQNLHKYINQL